LEREDFPYDFDADRAIKAIRFIELLPHVKGKWAGRRELITLEPWQLWIVGCIFGWVRKSDGVRRFLEAYIEVCRKNGKSVLAAGIGLYCLLEDGEFGAEVYSGASTEKQAWEVFRPARLMAKRTPELLEHYDLEVNASNLLRLEDFSRFEPLIGDPGDGASPSLAIVDEFHEHAKPNLYDTMKTGMGGREQPLMLIITTAGVDISGPCFEKRVEVQKTLDGVYDNDRLFGVIYTLDEDDDWKDRNNWRKANPNLGVSVSEDYLESQIQAAIRTPSKQNTVRTKHFDIWCGAKAIWLPLDQWASSADSSLSLDGFEGERCFLGIDLAVRLDVLASVLLFTRTIEDKTHYFAFPQFYLPDGALEKSKNADRYRGWEKEGYITLHDGEEVDFRAIQNDVVAIPHKHQLVEAGFDIWQGAQMAQALREEHGIETTMVRTTYDHMTTPMLELEAAIASGRFHHPNNSVFNWMASNVVAKSGGMDNRMRPVKEIDENKIDGIVALLMAMNRAMTDEPVAVSPWEDEEYRIS
jgi:phage terminase large subunit-like protein